MISLAIFSFLMGAVLAWAFRVWILVPVTLLTIVAATMVGGSVGSTVWSALNQTVLAGMLPQVGYGFGLFVRHILVVVRAPAATEPRSISVAQLYRKRASYDEK